MSQSPPTLSPRSRLVLFLTTLILMAVVAVVIWTVSGPDTDSATAAEGMDTATIDARALGVVEMPTLAGAIPTPIITPATGQGGQELPANPPLLSTPTLLPELAALGAPDEVTEPAPTETAVLPTPDLPTSTAESPTATNVPTEPPSTVPEPPVHVSVNGVPYETIVVMPDAVIQRAREIFAAGLALGRNPRAYSRVGDSTTELPHFLARYDTGPYELGQYAHLQPAIDYFHGSHGRDSVAVRIAMHSWTANDPAWADKTVCQPNETPVNCEIRLHNPSILLIRLGTNDVGVPSMFDANIRQIVETAVANGVIPVIGTKADRHEGSNENNDVLRRVAADYQIPLWDFDAVANTLPGRGLDQDLAHMLTFYSHDFNDPTAFTRGHSMHNLTALMMLDAIWRDIMLGGPR